MLYIYVYIHTHTFTHTFTHPYGPKMQGHGLPYSRAFLGLTGIVCSKALLSLQSTSCSSGFVVDSMFLRREESHKARVCLNAHRNQQG